jgi:hypothetical protein
MELRQCSSEGLAYYVEPFSTICQSYRSGQFYWWRKPENPEETTDLSQVTDVHNAVSNAPRHERVAEHTINQPTKPFKLEMT